MLPVIASTLPDFRIRDHPELVELLGLTLGGHVEAYNPSEDQWDCHSVDTNRQICADAVLLFRTLPSGLGGRRFAVSKCPKMLDEMNRLKPTYKQTPLPSVSVNTSSTPGLGHSADPSTPQCSSKQRRLDLASTPSNSSLAKRTFSNDASSTSPKPFPFPISSTPPSPTSTHTRDPNSQPVGDGTLKDRPFCGRRLYRGGERIWPCSFYVQDIVEGLEKIEILTYQKYPRITQETAFKMTFGLRWKKSMFQSHNRTYHQNKGLICKYRETGWQGVSWTVFVARTKEAIAVASDSDSDDTISLVSQPNHTTETGSEGADWDPSSDDETPVLDPAFTCPFCDLPWPEHPSGKLVEMREALEKISEPDPGSHSANPNHRRVVPATAAGQMCSLHRFETTTIGIAIQRGWPQTIDFTKVIERVWAMEDTLTEIVNDPEASLFYQILKKLSKKLGSFKALGSGGSYAFSSRYGLGTG